MNTRLTENNVLGMAMDKLHQATGLLVEALPAPPYLQTIIISRMRRYSLNCRKKIEAGSLLQR